LPFRLPGPRSNAFTVEDLIDCYAQGVFPMADARDDDRIFLIDPERRGIIPLAGFHVPARLARTVRSDRFQVRIDTCFEAVVEACAASRPGRTETWINRPIQALYAELYRRGQAHSVEAWRDGELVGGLYGVTLGGAFFGESMFSTERDASKVALVHLVGRLIFGRYRLLDAQFMTEHLAQFGAQEIPRSLYRKRLAAALAHEADFYRLPAYAAGEAVLQAITQAS
jgi:leucyl/phenylalanyl-tRNA--protein transferase